MNGKAKGTRNEHRSIRLLEATGYACTCAAASLGAWDIIGIGSKDVVLVQVKTRDWPGSVELETLRLFSAPENARKLIHRWRDRQRLPCGNCKNGGRRKQMKGHGEKRSRKTEQFIAALLTEPTIEAAAKKVGIGEVTAWRWMKDRAFGDQYREARREAMRRTTARLQGASLEAVDALREIQHAGESESARVSAARTILEQALKATDLEDVQQRLDALEQVVKSQPERSQWR